MYAALGSESDGVVKTPNLDRLAREGVRFTRFVANHPVCTPSRATLQTGLYAPVHGAGMNNLFLNPPHTTYLAEVFSRAGYKTGYVGKWHMDGGTDALGNPSLNFRPRELSYVPPGERRRGYQEFFGFECCPIHTDPFYWEEGVEPPVFTPVPEFGWDLRFQRAILREFVERHALVGEPWMYQVSFGEPHVPMVAPPEFLDLYDPETLPLPPWMPANLTSEQEAHARNILHVYYAMVSFLDDEIGHMMSDLEELGEADNTLIVFAGDNGNFLGSHWDDWFNFVPSQFQGKGLPSANAFRVPLIMRWPARIPAGKEVSALAGTVDLAPTILNLADLPVPWRMQGLDMSDWALGGIGPGRPAVWISLTRLLPPNFAAVWDGRYIYSEWDIRLLFDGLQDPKETTNLIDRPEIAGVQRRLGTYLYSMTLNAYNPPAFPDIAEAAGEAQDGITGLLPGDASEVLVEGMPVRAHVALAIGVGQGRGDDEILRDALLSAYAQNLDAFDRNDFQRARSLRALLTVAFSSSSALREFLIGAFADRFGESLEGGYQSVFCESAGACFPTDPFTPPALRSGPRGIEEPLAGTGDADMDGLTNAQEYENALVAGTGLEGFVRAAVDASRNGSEPPDGDGLCFIATAAYGTPLAAELGTLRGFRDRWLLTHSAGTAFTDAYYRLSPPVAQWIGPRPAARTLVRAALWIPLTFYGRVLAIAAMLFVWGVAGARKVRRTRRPIPDSRVA